MERISNTKIPIVDILQSRKGKFRLRESIAYWESYLLNRCMRLLTVKTDLFPEDEFKKKLIIGGMACVRKSEIYDNVGVYWCNPANITGQYPDYPETINYTSGTTETGIAYPGVDCVLVKNTSLALPIYPLVTRYATLLAHIDVTMLNVIANMRIGKSVPVAKSDSTAKSIKAFYNGMYNGDLGAIVDEEMTGIQTINICDSDSGGTLLDIVETRNNLVTMFFNDIGVQAAKNKKGNMLTPEIESDAPRLLLSINEMLDFWRKGADEIKEMFGGNIVINLSEEIKNQFSRLNEGGTNNESKRPLG